MRCSARIFCDDTLLRQWKKHLTEGQPLTKGDAFRLMRRTLNETQRAEQQQRLSFLASKGNSTTVWKALARHNITWRNSLTLMDAQLAAFSPSRREFVCSRLGPTSRLWMQLPHVIVGAWQTEDDMLAVFNRLLASETIVQFASIVLAAIRERPQLGGVLPVVSCVLLHCYELGGKQPDTALSCCRLLALVGPEKLPRSEREVLAFRYAMLYATQGQWSVALSVVNAAHEVRPSAKRLLWLHTSRIVQWIKAIECLHPVEPSFVASSIEYAPNWLCALRTYERWRSRDAAQALLIRKDCISAVGWEASLHFCSQNGVDSYGILRPILSMVPGDHPQRMQILTDATRATGESMYAGTLSRRAFKLAQRGEWAEAIGLLCGCRYYDVALPLAPYASRGAALPHELLAYEGALCRVNLPGGLQAPVSFEEQLAVALHGDWRQLKNVHDNARLKSLMLARSEPKLSPKSPILEESSEIQCFTFQSEELSRLVCLSASSKVQQYFVQVIPRELRKHHFGLRRRGGLKPVSPDRYAKFLSGNDIVTDGEGCNALCAIVVEHLRLTNKLSGEAFLREVSRCLASGKVQLTAGLRHEFSLAVLRATPHFGRLDATLSSRIALTTPLHYLTAHAVALESCMSALVLTGQWERAIVIMQRTKPPYPESSAALAYVAPRHLALNVVKLLWRGNPQDRWTLVLQDLLHGDTRFATDELVISASRTKFSNGRKDVQWRRRVLGACCALLQSSQSMHDVMQTAKLSTLCALDVDEHGLQRLLRVLSWEQALTAISDLSENNEVIDEHWLLIACMKPHIPFDAVSKGVSLFPYSFLLNTVRVYYQAVEEKSLVTAVKAVYRYQMLVMKEYRADATYLRPLVTLLKGLLLHYDGERWSDTTVWPLVRRLFNHIVEGFGMTQLGREGRRGVPVALREDKPLHALLIIGLLYHHLSRVMQMPIPANITSHLLRSAAYGTNDYNAALYFFKSLKHPNIYERSLLVFALRDVDDAMTLLLRAGRFVHDRPEQALLWSDSRRGSDRWLLSIELLSQSPPPRGKLLDLCRGWTWAEALRVMELLRRIMGTSPEAKMYAELVRECHLGGAANVVISPIPTNGEEE
ncbi:hypothetical protein, conserved [Trypanosoma brucei gambiense DAL972]|uniref:Uncharacterized protein n=1 Tax=Trypanosoma brucei gambiense (strain MHOM/CI/86/DAL972) TaxID=679716 RepID=C9ZLV9_TRYB9|nr:hypothetical protein, conserved [Trypanosoma brucei gambiense DAL972]CBH10384.1 hypothetical protein, conserved [Trypanosoma brucei gambiense DAL972]|eukprot:XP_011772674.1 hypothetical protein, conserved [Trypanosoma brucei gambiense DAL972]